ncbi:MAG: conjugal transfer protein TrbF [Pseudomonadota bacterium]
MWKRSQQSYGSTPVATTPYQKAAQVWDDRIGSARVQARNWRLAALLAILLSMVMTVALIWRSSQSIVTPYVVELTTDGNVRAVQSAVERYEPNDAQIAYQLGEFIKNVRSVSIDPIVLRENWLAAYDHTTDQAAVTLNEYARANDPFADVGQRSVSVEITSIVRASEDSFDVRWRETRFRSGVQISEASFAAVLAIVIDPPQDEATLHKNPLGIYVHGINWSRDRVQGGNQ